jgi:hypothetical protein
MKHVKNMQKKALTETNYPPPPPLPQKRSQKKLLAIVAIAIIAVAAIAGAYYLTNNTLSFNPSPSPTPSQTPAPSSSPGTSTNPSSSPTASPTSTTSGPFANYRAGAWANYTSKSYDASGAVTEENSISYAVSEGTRNGVACWVLTTESGMGQGDVMKLTYWISKSNPESIHIRSQLLTDGVVVSDTESDLNVSDFDLTSLTLPASSTVVAQETITVPAGTFNCEKSTTTMTVYGITSVSDRWVNSNIPILGLVKSQTTDDGVLKSTIELIAYSR